MFRRLMTLALPLVVLGGIAFTADEARAQSKQRTGVGQLVSGLVNVNVGAVAVNIGDITVDDVVDVENVLNNNQIDILRNAIQNNPIASNNQDVLNNLLREADLITNNQIVVGVLGGNFVVFDLP